MSSNNVVSLEPPRRRSTQQQVDSQIAAYRRLVDQLGEELESVRCRCIFWFGATITSWLVTGLLWAFGGGGT